jgi:hypothetical protein
VPHINACAFAISNTPGTSGAFIVSAAISGPYRVPRSADNGKTFKLYVYEGSAWEVCDSVYTHSGTSMSRGALEDSSTGSRVNFTSAAVVQVISASAAREDLLDWQLSRGAVIVRNDGTTTLSVAASTFTKLTCINAEEADPLGWWDNANARFQPTRAGIYSVSMGATVNMALTTVGQVASVLGCVRKNGSDFAHVARAWVYQDVGIAAKNVGVSGSVLVSLNGSTDFVEPFVWQNDPGASARSTLAGAERQFFMAHYLSAS